MIYINIIKNVISDMFDKFIDFWKSPFGDNNVSSIIIHSLIFIYIQFKMITSIGWPFLINIVWPANHDDQIICILIYILIFLVLFYVSCLEIFIISKVVKSVISYKESYILKYGDPFDNEIEECNTEEHHYTWTD